MQQQMEQIAVEMPGFITNLQDANSYSDNINDLFRMVHNLKSVINYLHIDNAMKFVTHAEDVLNAMRNRQTMPNNPKLIEWLELACDQFDKWQNELSLSRNTVSAPDPSLLSMFVIRHETSHPKMLLKPLNVLIVSPNVQLQANVIKGISPFVQECHGCSTFDEAARFYHDNKPHIIVSAYQLDDDHTGLELYKHLTSSNQCLPWLMLVDGKESKTIRKVALFGIPMLRSPLNLKKLVYELIDIAHLNYGKQRVSINAPVIKQLVENIQPLPDSINETIRLCNDPDTDIKQITQMVKRDPILTALVIKEANSPLYNQQIQTVDRAVAFFGKRIVKALSLSLSVKQLQPISLKAFDISLEDFQRVATMRLALMMTWYGKIDISKLNVLASTAMIGNLGQIVISKALEEMGVIENFQEMCRQLPVEEAEQKMLETTTPEVTADILKSWNFDQLSIDSLRYLNEPKYAPSEAYEYAVANHIVYHLIPFDTKAFPTTIPSEIQEFAKQAGCDLTLLDKAIQRLS